MSGSEDIRLHTESDEMSRDFSAEEEQNLEDSNARFKRMLNNFMVKQKNA